MTCPARRLPTRRRVLRVTLALCLAGPGFAALASAPAAAHGTHLGALSIGHFWAPPSEPGAAGAPVYGPLFNQGQAVVHLRGASTPAADRVRLRISKDGKTEWPETLDLAPGRPLALAPWRVHFWLERLHAPLTEGMAVPLTLDFGDAGTATIDVIVEKSASD